MNNYDFLTKECFICGGQLSLFSYRYINCLCEKHSKITDFGGTSEYVVTFDKSNLDIPDSIEMYLSSIKSKVVYYPHNNRFIIRQYYKDSFFDGISKQVFNNLLDFDLLEYMRTNTKVELAYKLENIFIFG